MEPAAKEKLEQVEKICQSDILQHSELLKAFLRYVVLKNVDDPGAQPKEYSIATEVFGRDKKFDSRQDPVVRVQANRLRAKLQKYYATEGIEDKVVLSLPKGHYIPTFSYADDDRKLRNTSENRIPLETSTNGAVLKPMAYASSLANRRTKLIVGLAMVCLIVGLLIVLSYRILSTLSQASANPKAGSSEVDSVETQRLRLLWDDFVNSTAPILVTFSNTTFLGSPQQGLKYFKPLDPGNPKPAINSSQEGVGQVAKNTPPLSDHYTGTGEVMAVYSLGNIFWKIGKPFRVKRSLLLDWEDIKTGNIVVLGSTAENIFLRDLPQKQDFTFASQNNQTFDVAIVNLRPQEGEQKFYTLKRLGPSTQQIVEDYALISLLRGLDGKSKIMVLAGLTTIATQAAAEYVAKPEYIKELITHLNISDDPASPKLPTSFQIVVRVKVNGGVPVQLEYVTHHIL